MSLNVTCYLFIIHIMYICVPCGQKVLSMLKNVEMQNLYLLGSHIPGLVSYFLCYQHVCVYFLFFFFFFSSN